MKEKIVNIEYVNTNC